MSSNGGNETKVVVVHQRVQGFGFVF
jgi:hypothetical protein